MNRRLLTLWVTLSAGGCSTLAPIGTADLAIINAHVWTGTGQPASAVAVQAGRIVTIGSDAHVSRWIGNHTNVIDANGRRVIPGITDCHVHIVSGGLQLARLNLREAANKSEFLAAVQQSAVQTPPGEWILGGRWSVESWPIRESPTTEWVDAVTGDRPLFLNRMDGHQALANTVALRLAGIDQNGPPDPAGGVIERNPDTGEPTGILKDSAMGLVSRHIPSSSADQLYAALLRAMKHANSLGITAVHDVSGPDDLPVMQRAHHENAMTVRIRKFISTDDWPATISTVKDFDPRDQWLTVAGFKGYMDGSMGSRTAYMYRPYDDASPHGDYPGGILAKMASPPKLLRYMIERADAAGLQCVVHAIGDEANHLLLDAYQAIARKHGPRDRRHRIEHAQHLLPEDINRFAELGVTASMQPYHKADDGRYAEIAIGRNRLRGSYAFRSLIESGALVCFGSDWPVVTVNPFQGIAAAVTGRTLDTMTPDGQVVPGRPWIPQENITVEQALQCYTLNAARSAFSEKHLGTIEPGKLADMVILSQDVLTIPPDDIADTAALVTIVDGRIVYDGR